MNLAGDRWISFFPDLIDFSSSDTSTFFEFVYVFLKYSHTKMGIRKVSDASATASSSFDSISTVYQLFDILSEFIHLITHRISSGTANNLRYDFDRFRHDTLLYISSYFKVVVTRCII